MVADRSVDGKDNKTISAGRGIVPDVVVDTRYEALLDQALQDLGEDPGRVGVKPIPDVRRDWTSWLTGMYDQPIEARMVAAAIRTFASFGDVVNS